MGEKDDSKKESGEKKPDGDKKSDGGPINVVLKLDLHCEGCAKKIRKSISKFEGVENVKTDTSGNKLTVIGKVDPTRIKERVEYKTKKKVEIISPQPKKDGGGGGGGGGGGEEKKKESPPEKKSDEKKTDEKKPKEPQLSTVVLKIPLHCDGCMHKIKRLISKSDGVESVSIDAGKDLVSVKGTMNVKELIPHLKEKFKRNIDIIAPKKDEKGGETKDDKKEKGDGGNANKSKEGGGGDGGDVKAKDKKSGGSGGGDTKVAEGGGGGGGDSKSKSIDVVNKLENNGHNPYMHTMQMQMYNQNYYNQDYGVGTSSSHGYVQEGYNHGYNQNYYNHGYSRGPPMAPPPMYLNDPRGYQPETGMFSDENPNACLVM
ncbi:heavy metal-associated isoprenylated plant protein 6-like [Rutidosis leptorrhynchoides]|uniref:heavy metal-associated isoprenylated plant protein 6-like n=1 Tax=Rutidosis leptorrhynchoides TaxID=125765 RepID=UPI003A99D70A